MSRRPSSGSPSKRSSSTAQRTCARQTPSSSPGSARFRDAIAALRLRDLVRPIEDHIAAGRPFLGICLGLQLLFDVSFEDGEFEGLGIIPGKVVRFASQPGLRIPHMGWNEVTLTRPHPVFAGLPDRSHFYFVHSYHVVPEDESVILGLTDHGGPFVSAIARESLVATQFHPEKSQQIGRRLLENFARQFIPTPEGSTR